MLRAFLSQAKISAEHWQEHSAVSPYVAPGFSLAAFLRSPRGETLLRDHGYQALPR
jgi:hypothetical protein